MRKFIENLKVQAEENPLIAIAVASTTVTVVTKFMKTLIESRNARSWAIEVARRAAKDSKRI